MVLPLNTMNSSSDAIEAQPSEEQNSDDIETIIETNTITSSPNKSSSMSRKRKSFSFRKSKDNNPEGEKNEKNNPEDKKGEEDEGPILRAPRTRDESKTKRRASYLMKTKGKLFFKKKGPFSKWRLYFVVLDDCKLQMNFFKSEEDYESLASCKHLIDLRFVSDIKAQKQKLLQSNLPMKMQRRAGYSAVKLAACNEEERAKWMTTIEGIIRKNKLISHLDFISEETRSSTLPNALGDTCASSDSETPTSTSAPEQEDIIKPKKLSTAGFKPNSEQITSIRLKKIDTTKKESENIIKDNLEEETSQPTEPFGVSLKRVQTESGDARKYREKSPEYIEFKQKYNTLSLSRQNKSAKLPLNENLTCSHLVENINMNDLKIADKDQSRTANKEAIRKRSPSPNIPISKAVESVIKNKDADQSPQYNLQPNLNVCHAISTTICYPESSVLEMDESVSNSIEECFVESLDNDSSEAENDQTDAVEKSKYSIITSKPDILQSSRVIPTIKINTGQDTFVAHNATDDRKEQENVQSANINTGVSKETNFKNSQANDNSTTAEGEASLSSKINEIKDESQIYVASKRESEYQNCSIYKINHELKVVDIKANEEKRSSCQSFYSQISTESDEPLPKLNFLGRGDRSSSGSAKDFLNYDERKMENEFYSGEFSDQPPMLRDNSTKLLGSNVRPESSNYLEARSSLVQPEFTVVEEPSEDLVVEPSKVETSSGSSLQKDKEDNEELPTSTKHANNEYENCEVSHGTDKNSDAIENEQEKMEELALAKSVSVEIEDKLNNLTKKEVENNDDERENQEGNVVINKNKEKNNEEVDEKEEIKNKKSNSEEKEENKEEKEVIEKENVEQKEKEDKGKNKEKEETENKNVQEIKKKEKEKVDEQEKKNEEKNKEYEKVEEKETVIEKKKQEAEERVEVKEKNEKVEKENAKVDDKQEQKIVDEKEKVIEEEKKNAEEKIQVKEREATPKIERQEEEIKKEEAGTEMIENPKKPSGEKDDEKEGKEKEKIENQKDEEEKDKNVEETERKEKNKKEEVKEDTTSELQQPLAQPQADKPPQQETAEMKSEEEKEEEEEDYFPSYGGDVEPRLKTNQLTAHEGTATANACRTSGIAGLKEFLKEHQSDKDEAEVKGGISRLGHSPAIEKLRDEIP